MNETKRTRTALIRERQSLPVTHDEAKHDDAEREESAPQSSGTHLDREWAAFERGDANDFEHPVRSS